LQQQEEKQHCNIIGQEQQQQNSNKRETATTSTSTTVTTTATSVPTNRKMPKCDVKTRYIPATFAWMVLLLTTCLFFFYP